MIASQIDQVRIGGLLLGVVMLLLGVAVGISLGAAVRARLRRRIDRLDAVLDEQERILARLEKSTSRPTVVELDGRAIASARRRPPGTAPVPAVRR